MDLRPPWRKNGQDVVNNGRGSPLFSWAMLWGQEAGGEGALENDQIWGLSGGNWIFSMLVSCRQVAVQLQLKKGPGPERTCPGFGQVIAGGWGWGWQVEAWGRDRVPTTWDEVAWCGPSPKKGST